MQTKFLRLTSELNALDYLERTVSFIRETQKSDLAWKWAAIALHGALYGFAVSACYGTSASSVLQGKRNDHLIGFGEALRRCEEGIDGWRLLVSPDERKSIDDLKNILRDKVEHFQPETWLVALNGITTLSLNCIGVIERMATTGWVSVRLRDQQQRIGESVAEARALLTTLPL